MKYSVPVNLIFFFFGGGGGEEASQFLKSHLEG